MTKIIAGQSPFTPTNFRPRTTAARLLNGEPIDMAKTSNNGTTPLPTTTSKPAMPAGTIRSPFSTSDHPVALPADPPKPIAIDFDDGKPPVVLDAAFPRNADGQPIDADASVSPDEQDSPMAAPPRDDSKPNAVNTPTTHWSLNPTQMKQFTDFVTGLINDYALFDRDEQGALKDWTVDSYLEKRSVDLSFYPTFTAARRALDEMLLGEFKDDLKAIMVEKKCPKNMSTPLALIGHETIEDGIRAMTGKGVRTAITGKLRSLEQAEEIDSANAAQHRQIEAQHAEQAAPVANVEAPKAEPVKQDVIIETAEIVDDAPITPKTNAVTVVKQQTVAIPYWQTPKWQVDPMQMAEMVAKSGMYKGIDTAPKAFVVMMKGVELGLSPMTAFGYIHLIPGAAPAASGALVLGMLRKSGVKIEFLERTPLKATVRMSRDDTGESYTVTWTIEDARKAGLAGKDNWNKYATQMLTWRAAGDCSRLIGTDILAFGGLSLYLREEIDESMTSMEDAA